jgi:hypothetical protein
MSWLLWDLGILANNQWGSESAGLAKMQGGGEMEGKALAEIACGDARRFWPKFPHSPLLHYI